MNKKLIAIILFGIVLRLVFAFLFNHVFDFFNILAIVKSVADTGNVTGGFFVLKDHVSIDVQLYGKIYYQIIALWLHFLDKIHLIDIDYIFDLQGYDPAKQYMSGFGSWGPLHYQLVLIKLIQFFYDFTLLFFLIKTAQLLFGMKRSVYLITLFWALNPFLIYPSYVPFQSDLAMVTCLVAGVYFALRSAKMDESEKIMTKNKFLVIFFFALGAVIKQVPMLFLVPIFIILSSSIMAFISSLLAYGGIYVFLTQPWGSDSFLFKSFFLTSEESTAILNFNLNSASIFIMLYLAILLFTFYYRKSIRHNPLNILKLCVFIFCVIFISEDLRFLFAQFCIWPMPFIALLMIDTPLFGLAFIPPIIGFYRWIIVDNSSMTGSLWITLGRGLDRVPSFNSMAEVLIAPDIIHTIFNSFFIFSYVCLLIFTVTWIRRNKLSLPAFRIRYIILGLSILYFGILGFDYAIRSSQSLLANIQYSGQDQQSLGNNHFVMIIQNPDGRLITGISPMIFRKKITNSDRVVMKLTDPKTGKELLTQKYSDIIFPNGIKEYHLRLKRPLKDKSIQVEIYKEFGFNELYIQTAKSYKKGPLESGYGQYDVFYRNSSISLTFPKQIFVVNVEGQYGISDALNNIGFHISQKPSFYILYLGMTGALFLIGVSLFLMDRYSVNKP